MSSIRSKSAESDTDDDYIRPNEDESSSSFHRSSPSPPSYAVHEDEHGNLINRGLCVTWPARPNYGRHSLNQYEERKRLQREQYDLHKAFRDCRRQFDERKYGQPDAARVHVPQRTRGNGDVFVGVRTASSLRSMLRPTEFLLFYKRPETMNSFNEMPLKMPLTLAYMSASGKMYNFGFIEHELDSGKFWQLDLNDCANVEQPIFRSMSALIKHYKSFIINRGDGTAEIFPVIE